MNVRKLKSFTYFILFYAAGLSVLCSCQSFSRWVDRREGIKTDAPYGYIPKYDYDANNHASGAAYAAEHFSWHVPTPSRPKNDYQFYYKRCERNGVDSPFISKVEWTCSESPL